MSRALEPGDPLPALRDRGFAFVGAARMGALLGGVAALADWASFAASWEGMPRDAYMADGGRYRRRRHGLFAAPPAGALHPAPHRPHYQSRDYNALNGGIPRWFAPIPATVAEGPTMAAILGLCRSLFEQISGPSGWDVEVHQFRITAEAGGEGRPTPEGAHRDGVDHVLVLMIRRENIASGETSIHDLAGRELGHFTLATPLDAALVDDRRVLHGVTPVIALDPARPAFRDVLVVTFRRDPAPSGSGLSAGGGQERPG